MRFKIGAIVFTVNNEAPYHGSIIGTVIEVCESINAYVLQLTDGSKQMASAEMLNMIAQLPQE